MWICSRCFPHCNYQFAGIDMLCALFLTYACEAARWQNGDLKESTTPGMRRRSLRSSLIYFVVFSWLCMKLLDRLSDSGPLFITGIINANGLWPASVDTLPLIYLFHKVVRYIPLLTINWLTLNVISVTCKCLFLVRLHFRSEKCENRLIGAPCNVCFRSGVGPSIQR